MENILYLRKMGLNFWDDEIAKSDIKNYRVRTLDECVPGKDGRLYFIEFSLWRNRKQVRYTHKVTGKPLKYPKYDIINPQAVAIDTEYSDANGSWRNATLEERLHTKNYSYNTADILAIVNEISTQKYDSVVFVN